MPIAEEAESLNAKTPSDWLRAWFFLLGKNGLVLRAGDNAVNIADEAAVALAVGEAAIAGGQGNIDAAEKVSHAPIFVGATRDLPCNACLGNHVNVEV